MRKLFTATALVKTRNTEIEQTINITKIVAIMNKMNYPFNPTKKLGIMDTINLKDI